MRPSFSADATDFKPTSQLADNLVRKCHCAPTVRVGWDGGLSMLEQDDIDALLASATELADETGAEVGAAVASSVPPPPPSKPSAPRLPADVNSKEVERILGMQFPLVVVLAEKPITFREILTWNTGAIVEFDSPCDSDLHLMVGNRKIARGLAVKVGEYFGIRIYAPEPVEDRIRAMGG